MKITMVLIEIFVDDNNKIVIIIVIKNWQFVFFSTRDPTRIVMQLQSKTKLCEEIVCKMSQRPKFGMHGNLWWMYVRKMRAVRIIHWSMCMRLTALHLPCHHPPTRQCHVWSRTHMFQRFQFFPLGISPIWDFSNT